MSRFRSPKLRNVLIAVIVILVLVFSTAYYVKIGASRSTLTNSTSTTSSSSLSSTGSVPTGSVSSQTFYSTTNHTSYDSTNQTNTNVTTQTSTTYTYDFNFQIWVNYSGSWNLVYSAPNGTSNEVIHGNVNGSGNYHTYVRLVEAGTFARTLCANATKLDSQNLTLSLEVVSPSNSTTTSRPWAYVCATVEY